MAGARDLSHVVEGLIYCNDYGSSLPGFEQGLGNEFMTCSELIDYSNYNRICKGSDQAFSLSQSRAFLGVQGIAR